MLKFGQRDLGSRRKSDSPLGAYVLKPLMLRTGLVRCEPEESK